MDLSIKQELILPPLSSSARLQRSEEGIPPRRERGMNAGQTAWLLKLLSVMGPVS